MPVNFKYYSCMGVHNTELCKIEREMCEAAGNVVVCVCVCNRVFMWCVPKNAIIVLEQSLPAS